METFNLVRKSKQNKGLSQEPSAKEPPGPHVLEVAQGLQDMLDAGVVNSRAELARRRGVSRARITQILSLLKLPAEIQEQILRLPDKEQRYFTERKRRETVRLDSSKKQRDAFARLMEVITGGRACPPRRTGP